jgi:hypothetical protein
MAGEPRRVVAWIKAQAAGIRRRSGAHRPGGRLGRRTSGPAHGLCARQSGFDACRRARHGSARVRRGLEVWPDRHARLRHVRGDSLCDAGGRIQSRCRQPFDLLLPQVSSPAQAALYEAEHFLALLAEGLTCAEIAAQLVVSRNTVRFHVKGIYGKGGTARRRPWRGRGNKGSPQSTETLCSTMCLIRGSWCVKAGAPYDFPARRSIPHTVSAQTDFHAPCEWSAGHQSGRGPACAS